MRKIAMTIMLLALLNSMSGCKLSDEIESISEFKSSEKIWIFSQINVNRKNNKIEEYFYYGQINKSLYEKIKAQKIKHGFFAIENVRYWTTDNKIAAFSDDMSSGELLFRIEDIRKIELQKSGPVIGYKYPDE